MAGPEARIEAYLRKEVEAAGGLCWKWVSPANAGVPDRIVMLAGRVVFVELKAAGERPRPLQLVKHRQLRAVGMDVRVIDSRDGCRALVRELTA
ncbi:VRR-NUC domain-containing protein [Micrococcus antarcticus]|uniref:VRR-NUC domain-containing protein n=1 Tax=Micrococcus antarcticus TaxID=86171 RepID=UPI00385032E4